MKNTVSSIESLTSSVESDNDTYHWFKYLISHREVSLRLQRQPDIQKIYVRLKQNSSFQVPAIGVFLLLFAEVFLLRQYVYIFLAVLLLFLLFRLSAAKKKNVADISRQLLLQDFEEQALSQKTLYQVGEEYSRRLGIPSLVDSIYFRDKFLRRGVLISLLGGVLIFSFSALQAFIGILVASTLVYALVSSSFIFRFMR